MQQNVDPRITIQALNNLCNKYRGSNINVEVREDAVRMYVHLRGHGLPHTTLICPDDLSPNSINAALDEQRKLDLYRKARELEAAGFSVTPPMPAISAPPVDA